MVDFDLLLRYFAGKANPEEAMAVEEWAASEPDHHAYFMTLYQAWQEAGNEHYALPDVRAVWETFITKGNIIRADKRKASSRGWLAKIAAAMAIFGTAIAGYYLFNRDNQNEKKEVFVAEHSRDSLRLADGTMVLLPESAELVYPSSFAQSSREVTLVGNGTFQVAPDSGRPFIVHLGEVHVRVLGTRFEVERKKGKIQIKVTEGKVAFYSKSDTLNIAAGHLGIYSKTERKFKLSIPEPQRATFNFNDAALSGVIRSLNQSFGVNIHLENAGLSNCRLSAVFDQQPLEYILEAITETFNLSYKIDSANIYISGTACH